MAVKQIALSTTDFQKICNNLVQTLKFPSDVQSVMSHFEDSLAVASPVQSVVQVNSQLYVFLNHLRLFSWDGRSSKNPQLSLLFCSCSGSKCSTGPLRRAFRPSLIQPAESSEYFWRWQDSEVYRVRRNSESTSLWSAPVHFLRHTTLASQSVCEGVNNNKNYTENSQFQSLSAPIFQAFTQTSVLHTFRLCCLSHKCQQCRLMCLY